MRIYQQVWHFFGVHLIFIQQQLLNHTKYPLVNIQKAIENGPVEMVDFPIKHGGPFIVDFPINKMVDLSIAFC